MLLCVTLCPLKNSKKSWHLKGYKLFQKVKRILKKSHLQLFHQLSSHVTVFSFYHAND